MRKMSVAVILFALMTIVTVATAEEYEYTSMPKGVVCEGLAAGIDPVSTIQYDAGRNAFVINGNSFYVNPVSKGEFREIVEALALHNHLGVSIRPDRSFFTYGRLQSSAQVARELSNADRLLGGVMFAVREYIGNRRLPGNYSPKPASNRRILSTSTFKFMDYSFAKGPQNIYRRAGFDFQIVMTPVRTDQRAADGGYVRDRAAESRGDMEPADRENYNHINQYRNDYLAMPEIEKAVRIGEAAAFVRWVRGGMIGAKGMVTGGRTELLQQLAGQMR